MHNKNTLPYVPSLLEIEVMDDPNTKRPENGAFYRRLKDNKGQMAGSVVISIYDVIESGVWGDPNLIWDKIKLFLMHGVQLPLDSDLVRHTLTFNALTAIPLLFLAKDHDGTWFSQRYRYTPQGTVSFDRYDSVSKNLCGALESHSHYKASNGPLWREEDSATNQTAQITHIQRSLAYEWCCDHDVPVVMHKGPDRVAFMAPLRDPFQLVNNINMGAVMAGRPPVFSQDFIYQMPDEHEYEHYRFFIPENKSIGFNVAHDFIRSFDEKTAKKNSPYFVFRVWEKFKSSPDQLGLSVPQQARFCTLMIDLVKKSFFEPYQKALILLDCMLLPHFPAGLKKEVVKIAKRTDFSFLATKDVQGYAIDFKYKHDISQHVLIHPECSDYDQVFWANETTCSLTIGNVKKCISGELYKKLSLTPTNVDDAVGAIVHDWFTEWQHDSEFLNKKPNADTSSVSVRLIEIVSFRHNNKVQYNFVDTKTMQGLLSLPTMNRDDFYLFNFTTGNIINMFSLTQQKSIAALRMINGTPDVKKSLIAAARESIAALDVYFDPQMPFDAFFTASSAVPNLREQKPGDAKAGHSPRAPMPD